jgi:hypothetical protein
MRPEAARVRRLQRLEQVRALAKQSAAREAAQAEGTLSQLEALAARTQAMADDYRGRTALRDGLDLRQLGSFVSGLSGITAATQGDADQARALANRKLHELAQAERRRAAAEDRAKAGQRALVQQQVLPVLGARRAVGTDLE